jgi:hypothetical protein
MHVRSLCLACSLALILIATPVRAQRADDLMDQVGEWVHEFVEQFANVVAEEDYVPNQVYQSPRLRSDYLLVRYPGSSSTWQTFATWSLSTAVRCEINLSDCRNCLSSPSRVLWREPMRSRNTARNTSRR